MKITALTALAAAVLIGGLAGCSSQTQPANNNLNTVSPIPETTASLVPKAKQDVGAQVGSQGSAGVGGEVGQQGKSAGIGGGLGVQGK